MKLLILTFVIAAASAVPHWDESGQYRILDDDAVKISRTTVKVDPYYSYYPYYRALADSDYVKYYYPTLAASDYARYQPLYARYLKTSEPAYVVKGVQYKAYQPFVYSYRLVKDIDA